VSTSNTNPWMNRLSPTSLKLDVFNRALDRHVKLAVTGLSRSGKTVFITSLVHQLLHGTEGTHLPFFEIVGSGRLIGTKIMPQPHMHIPTFRYDTSIEQLCGELPTWPDRTSNISEIRLAMRYRSQNIMFKHVAPVSTLYLDITDYPGEWLLDLPLLELSFEQWCEQIIADCKKQPRLGLSAQWRAFMEKTDLQAPARDATLREGAQLYTDFLYAGKEAGLSLLQPGRFTMPMPGESLKDAPILEFFPVLEIPYGFKDESSLYSVLKRRYDSYKEHVVKKFYTQHLSNYDRQIVLVDALRTLNLGYPIFEDMRNAVNMVLHSFRYGKTGLFSRLLGLKIDKMLLAATKADHITPNQLPNLERFLQLMLAKSQNNASFEGVITKTLALSAVKCTQAANATFQGQKVSCIKGVPLNDDKPIALFPGEVPVEIPMPEEWVKDRFNFVEFKPPRLANVHGDGLPHIRMDRALEFLLGDKF